MNLKTIKMKLNKNEKLTVENIESKLKVFNQTPLRWAIVDYKDEKFIIDAVVTY